MKIHRTRLSVLFLLALGACDGATDSRPVQALTITGGTVEVRAYEDTTLSVVATDPEGDVIEHPRLTWTTSNAAVATVDGNGKVHGVALGMAEITAQAGEVTATAHVAVTAARMMSLNVVPDTVRALPGDRVSPVVVGTDRSGSTIYVYPTWSSADTAIAVPGYYDGAVARLPGTTRLYATIDGARDSVVLVVGPPPSFTIYPDTAVLLVGDTPDHLAAERSGTAGALIDLNRIVAWTSSDPGVATVDAAGNVTAVGPGAATITATLPGTGVASTTRAYVLRYQPALDFVSWQTRDLGGCGLTRSGQAYCTMQTRYFASAPRAFATAAPAEECRILVSDSRASYYDYGRCSRFPLAVDGGHQFTSLSSGSLRACGVDMAGAVWCWGAQPQRVQGLGTVAQVAVSSEGYCALESSGNVLCWGAYNSSGTQGNGTTTPSATPTPVAGGVHFRSVAGGGLNMCGVDDGGSAWCWGANVSGQVGDGTTKTALVPTLVQTPVKFASLYVSLGTACGLDAAGKAYCWGGAPASSPVPVAAPTAQSFRALALRPAGVCGITVQGTVVCWGASIDPNAPNPGPPGSDWVSISADFDQTCAVSATGRVACWTGRSTAGVWNVVDLPRGG